MSIYSEVYAVINYPVLS